MSQEEKKSAAAAARRNTSFVPPLPSRAQRNIPLASKGHCTIHAVLGQGAGVRINAESWTEYRNMLLLNARPDVAEIREQVIFEYGSGKKPSSHVFDLVAEFHDGRIVAYTVKPEVRLVSGRFLKEMREVAWWVREKRFADDVRLITEEDLDPVELHNAQIIAAVRGQQPEVDAEVIAIAKTAQQGRSLRDLTRETGRGADGYRALLRLVRDGVLRLEQRERITPMTLVAWSGESA